MSADPNVTAVGGVSFNPDFTSSGKIEAGIPQRAWNDTDDPSGAYPAPVQRRLGRRRQRDLSQARTIRPAKAFPTMARATCRISR